MSHWERLLLRIGVSASILPQLAFEKPCKGSSINYLRICFISPHLVCEEQPLEFFRPKNFLGGVSEKAAEFTGPCAAYYRIS